MAYFDTSKNQWRGRVMVNGKSKSALFDTEEQAKVWESQTKAVMKEKAKDAPGNVIWLKECEICNAGLCAEVDRLKESGLTENAACKQLVEQQEQILGEVIYSQSSIRNRYQWHRGKKVAQNEQALKASPGEKTPEQFWEGIARRMEKLRTALEAAPPIPCDLVERIESALKGIRIPIS